MKSMVCDYTSVRREVTAYQVLAEVGKTSGSTGKLYVRQALDQFELRHGDRSYHFLIHEALGLSVQFFLDYADGSLPIFYVKEFTSQMLQALEFIHSAHVIHAGLTSSDNMLCPVFSPLTLDLQPSNILLHIHDETVLKDGEEAEIEHPSARKIIGETVVFETRDLPGPVRRWLGGKSRPVLCDFGEARTGKDSYTEHIQPAVYRAPEVFLHLPWSTPVDIWNLGCMVRVVIIASSPTLSLIN
jgi:serine/threonine-protein kinase SRPK3